MWHIVFGVVGAVAIGAIKYFRSDEIKLVASTDAYKPTKNIGAIALWGVPNSGKSTFIKRLLGKSPDEQKIQTSFTKKYPNLEFESDGITYSIESIYDMPGVETRKSEWLEHVNKARNSIYLINLEKFFDEKDSYSRTVKQHLKELKEALDKNKPKNLIVVGTHLDKTKFSSSNEPNNLIQQSIQFELIREIFHSVWFYSVNLLDDNSCIDLIKSIVGDIDAKS